MQPLKIIIVVCLFVLSLNAKAGLITSDITGLGGDEYEISYTITNDSAELLDWFTLYFDYGLFSSIEVLSSSNVIWSDWDFIVDDPYDFDDGLIDGFADPADPIAAGGVLGGLIIKVLYSGSDISSWVQYATFPFYEVDEIGDYIEDESGDFIVNEDVFAFVSLTSFTAYQEPDNSTPVPEPGTLGIFLIALALITYRTKT